MADDPKDKGKKDAPTAVERIQAQKHLKQSLSNQMQSGRLKGTAGATPAPPPTKKTIDQASPDTKGASIPPPSVPRAGPGQPARPAAKAGPKPAAKPRAKSTPNAGAKAGAKPAAKPAAAGAKPEPKTEAESPPAGAENAVAWDPRKVRMFLTGVITLGELEGISKEEQYEIAEIGHQHLQQAHHEQAKQIFEGLAVLDPHDAYFQLALGAVAQRTGNLEEAEQRYSRAVEINPFLSPAYANRGEVRMLSGRMVDGAKDLLQALQEDPECRDVATKRARATLGVLIEELRQAGIEVPATPSVPARGPKSAQ